MYNTAILIAFFTTIIQCYNHALFGISGAELAKYFTPCDCASEQTSLVNFFKIFSIASIARPAGSIIFGRIADKFGRAICIKIAIILSAFSSISVGMIPRYDQIGDTASILLTVSRMVFLISLSGEIDALRVYVYEKIGKGRRYLANGVMSFCSQLGGITAAISYYFATTNANDGLWKMNFIIGGSLALLFLLVAGKYFSETEEFLSHKKKSIKKDYDPALTSIIWENFNPFIAAMLVSGCVGASFHFIIIFFCNFISQMACAIDAPAAKLINISLFISYAISAVFAGFLSDRIDPRRIIIGGISVSLIICLTVVAGILDVTSSRASIQATMMIMAGLLTFYAIPLQVINQSIFSVGVRMRMYGLSHSAGSVLLSSTTPLLASLVWEETSSTSMVFSFLALILTTLIISSLFLFKQREKLKES